MTSRHSEAADGSHLRHIGFIDGEATLRTPTQMWRADTRRSRLATSDGRRLLRERDDGLGAGAA
jgi:hypothetical protein